MRFRVLGPVAADFAGQPVPTGRPRQRAILGYLLLNRNTLVTTDRLVSALWEGQGPSTARNQVQTDMSILRRLIASAGAGDPIQTRPTGYTITLDPGQLDLDEFTARAREARATTDPATSIAILRPALELWSGTSLTGINAAYAASHRVHIEEQRVQAYEHLFDLELGLGRHADVAAELFGLVDRFPLRERLTGQLMLALYRNGNHVEALRVARDLRVTLVEQHGLDPGHALRELEQAILRCDPALDLAATPGSIHTTGLTATSGSIHATGQRGIDAESDVDSVVTPATLPAAPVGFIGRAAEIAALDAVVGSDRRVVALSGEGGIGKTALVTYWGQRSRSMFPSGQLYVNLRGFAGGAPMTPLRALGVLLQGLGVAPRRTPVDIDAASALFRTLTADLRLLVVLDNAQDTAQVRPLLPGGGGCLTIITSRSEMPGLVAREGARPMRLTVLTADESTRLLGSLLDRRAPTEIPARHDVEELLGIEELARLCAHLPLAIRIAAANLTERRDRTIAGYVEALRTGDRLSALQVPDDPECAVRAAFDLTYHTLDAGPRRLLRLIGAAPGHDLSTAAIAELAGRAYTTDLRILSRHHLVDEHAPGRYSVHDLLAVYATEQSIAVDSPADRAAMVARLLRHYLARARAAAAMAYPHAACLEPARPPAGAVASFSEAGAAMAWLEAERDNLVAIIVEPPAGATEFAWLLADQLRGFFALRRYDDDWLRTATAARAAARASGDDTGIAAAELSLGWALRSTAGYDRAMRHLIAAQQAAAGIGWRHGEMTALIYLGIVHSDLGQPAEGLRYAQRALDITDGLTPMAEALIRNNRGVMYLNCGRLDAAVSEFGRTAQIMRDYGSLSGQGMALTNRGYGRTLLGQYAEARRDLAHGLVLTRRAGDRTGASLAITTLAHLHLRRRQTRLAGRFAGIGVGLARDIGDPFNQAYALTVAAEARRTAADPAGALELGTAALAIARGISNLQYEIETLLTLGRAARDLDQLDDAYAWLTEALHIAERGGYRVCEAKALAALVTITAHRDPPNAAYHAGRALALATATGYHFDPAEAEQLTAAVAPGFRAAASVGAGPLIIKPDNT